MWWPFKRKETIVPPPKFDDWGPWEIVSGPTLEQLQESFDASNEARKLRRFDLEKVVTFCCASPDGSKAKNPVMTITELKIAGEVCEFIGLCLLPNRSGISAVNASGTYSSSTNQGILRLDTH